MLPKAWACPPKGLLPPDQSDRAAAMPNPPSVTASSSFGKGLQSKLKLEDIYKNPEQDFRFCKPFRDTTHCALSTGVLERIPK